MNHALKDEYLPRRESTWYPHTSFPPSLKNFCQLFITNTSNKTNSLTCAVSTTLLLCPLSSKGIQKQPSCTSCIGEQKECIDWERCDHAGWKMHGMSKVKGKTVHTVDFRMSVREPLCACKNWLKHVYRIPCKHFFAVFQIHPEGSWEELPQAYLDSSYLSLDTGAVE